jgi:putative oxygen-independent coproporphyrinogen III oxidase
LSATHHPAGYGPLTHYMRPGTLFLDALPPLSIYVHLPWCVRKCPYCDFNSHQVGAGPGRPVQWAGAAPNAPTGSSVLLPVDLENRYLAALMADLHAVLPLIWGRSVQTVFIGGGTPSLFSPQAMGRLISDLRSLLPLVPDCEITMEANPGTFEKHRFKAFRDAGVNRLSIGVQSFNDLHLQALGRVHDRAQSLAAVEEAAQHFDAFNIDLMYALPGQTLAQLDADLAQALAFSPPHVSAYHLTIEANTFFAKHPPPLPDDDLAYAMLDQIVEQTAKCGLERYEVSAFAKAGRRCAHNLNYWQFGDYVGIGAGAHGKLTFPHRVMRHTKVRDPQLYMKRALETGDGALAQEVQVPREDLAFEWMLGALRLLDGVPASWFQERTGLTVSTIAKQCDLARVKGFLASDPSMLRATPLGMDFLNDLQSLFLPN